MIIGKLIAVAIVTWLAVRAAKTDKLETAHALALSLLFAYCIFFLGGS